MLVTLIGGLSIAFRIVNRLYRFMGLFSRVSRLILSEDNNI
jgi:hypothetical protein